MRHDAVPHSPHVSCELVFCTLRILFQLLLQEVYDDVTVCTM